MSDTGVSEFVDYTGKAWLVDHNGRAQPWDALKETYTY